MLSIIKKPRLKEGIIERVFECERDGLMIRGTEYRPEGSNLPIAVVCHGFMAWQDTVKHYAALLAEMGYAAYCFDFNGGSVMKSRSTGKTTDMSVLTEMEDLEAVLQHLRTLPYVNREQIFLMGCSQGGLVSALVAAKNQYPIGKLCLFYPALCIPDDVRAGKMMNTRFDPDHVPETLWCGPMKVGRRYATDVKDMDPFEEIKAYNGQVCIVHGTADKIVSIEYAKRTMEAYLESIPEGMSRAQRVSMLTIDGGAHMFSKQHDRIAMEELKRFAAINP